MGRLPDGRSVRADAAQLTRKLPSHLRYAKPPAHAPQPGKRTPSQLAAELKGLERLPASLQRPRVVTLFNMSEFTHNVESVVPLDEPLFQPSPPEVVFDKFEPLQRYTTTIKFRNNDNVNRRIKVLAPDSSAFTIEAPKQLPGGGKVAPGMEVAFLIHFFPRAAQDYACELACVTEREKFVVSLSARGPRACFEFPDGVDFVLQPVRREAQEAFLLRNTGDRDGRFSLSVPAPFRVTPFEASVAAGQSLQIIFSFEPQSSGAYEEDLLITYDSGEQCFARLTGSAADMDVTLERNNLQLDPCYIALVSQRTVKLFNRSDVKVNFAWKACESGAHDEHVRLDRSLQLTEVAFTAQDSARGSSMLRQQRRAVEVDPLLFAHDDFSVQPLQGEIYPGGFCEFTVIFKPGRVGDLSATAYCEVSGREARLPLTVKGLGLGPKATWLYDTLDIGDVFINSHHRYEVVLENHGEIEATFSLQPNASLFASRFEFSPRSGQLQPREHASIEVRFCCDMLGEFNETFVWSLEGQPQPLPLLLKGRVVGPSFHFSMGEIEFGTVSLGFVGSASLDLHNISDIPMRFALRIPEDNLQQPEFHVLPASGAVLPHGKQKLQVDFMPHSVKKHSVSMLVDVEAVGNELLALPVKGQCLLPTIVAASQTLPFGDCFRGHTYTQSTQILNTSALPAKFEVVPQDPATLTIGKFECQPSRGIVDANGSVDVVVAFTAVRLGPLFLPFSVRVVGTRQPAFSVDIMATSVGPRVHVATESIDWGKTQVLQVVSRTLTITNDSLIPAEYSALLRKSSSPFDIPRPSGLLQPGETRELEVTVYLDDTIKTSDELILQARDSSERIVSLAATGVGSTVFCAQPLDVLNFGEHFSHRACQREITLENRGRKPQSLCWTNVSEPPKKSKRDKTLQASKKLAEGEGGTTFSISPDKVLMEPGAVCAFTVRGLSYKGGTISEELHCLAAVGTAKPTKPIFVTLVSATFVEPLLQPSEPDVSFVYAYEDSVPAPELSKALQLTNVSSLPLTVSLRAANPFSVNVSEMSLAPSESSTVHISFNAAFPGDRQTRKQEAKLWLSYREHPQKDGVRLIGETNFPNLEFELAKVDFGCVLNDTPKSLTLTMNNPTCVAANYSWSFAQSNFEPSDAAVLFDVLPIRGLLLPNATQSIEVLYKGSISTKAKAVALCEVAGGPEYELPLVAESSSVAYKLDKTTIDFGLQSYDRVEEKELSLSNTGRVQLAFSVLLHSLSRSNVVEVLPLAGKVAPGDRVRILVRLLPGLPDRVQETFEVQVAHLEPESVFVTAEGIYPRVAVGLPREESEEFARYLQQASELLAKQRAAAALSALENGLDARKEARPTTNGNSRPTTSQEARGQNACSPPLDRRSQKSTEGKRGGGAPEAEAEAERLRLCVFASRQLKEHARAMEVLRSGGSPGADGGAEVVTTMDTTMVSRASSSHRQRGPLIQPLPAPPATFSVARYVLDFGNVVYGSTKKRSFKVRNVGWQAISFDLDKMALLAMGFRIEPDKVVKLPGLPESESVDFSVTFQSKTGKRLGRVQHILRLELRPGPTVAVVLKANITMPELRLSDDVLDFGLLQACCCPLSTIQRPLEHKGIADDVLGAFFLPPSPLLALQAQHSKTLAITLHNPKEVAAEWEVRKPIEQARDWGFFRCVPEAGVLAPDAHQRLEVTFTPVAERNYSVKMLFKTVGNPRSVTLALKGVGRELALLVSPNQLELPPVLPYAEPVSVPFRLVNPSDYAIEVYAVELDQEYLREEEMLREAEAGEGDVLLLAPRGAGEPVWAEVAEQYALNHPAEAEGGEEDAAETDQREEGSVGDVQLSVAKDAEPRLIVVLIGPPLSGIDEQAKLVSEAFELPIVQFDEAVVAAAKAAHWEAADVDGDPADATDVEYHQELALPLDDDARAAAARRALSAHSHAKGFVLIFPDGTTAAGTPTALAAAAAAALGEEQRWTVAFQLPREVLEQRALAEHSSLLAEHPEPTPPADISEAEYEELSTQDVAQFEETRRLHRRAVAGWRAQLEALEAQREERLKYLLAAAEGFEAFRLEALQLLDPENAQEYADAIAVRSGTTPAPASAPEPSKPTKGTGGKAQPENAPVQPALEVDPPVPKPPRAPTVYSIDVQPEEESTFLRLRAVLPEPPDESTAAGHLEEEAPPKVVQLVRRPRARNVQPPVTGLELLTLPQPPPPSESIEVPEGDQETIAAAGATDDGETVPQSGPTKQTRWLLPPHSSQQLLLQYRATDTGRVEQRFNFEIVGLGAERPFSLDCAAVAAQPTISTDYRNVFHRKAKTRDMFKTSKTFVISRSAFEFGPLLVGRPQPNEKPHAEHSEQLHITNNGPFPLTVNFSFLNEGGGIHSALPVPAGLADADAAEGTPQRDLSAADSRPPVGQPAFFLWPEKMVLQPEETQDLLLSAYPTCNGLFEEQLVCTIKDNPQPVLFPLSAIGSTPSMLIDTSLVEFDRLLLRRSDTKRIILTSRSALRLSWGVSEAGLAQLAGNATEPGQEDFSLGETSGSLGPGESCELRITFYARDAREISRTFTIEVTDAAGELGVQQSLPVEVRAEAYSIDVDVAWPQPQIEGLDFGAFKVVDNQTTSMQLINNGKYDVGFKFLARKWPVSEILTMTPDEGTLVPQGARQEVTIVLKTSQELTLLYNTDLRLQFTELLTGEVLSDLMMPVKLSAHAVFSRYTVVPRGINFGPLVYESQKERTFELANTGEFEFRFSLRARDQRPGTAAPPASPTKGGGKATGAEPGGALVLDKFSVSPARGVVGPGGTTIITVKFSAGSAAESFSSMVLIDVADRDPQHDPEGLSYELLAESCIPGVSTTDYVQIFEEQAVQTRGDFGATGLPRNVFAEEERIFCFGSHMVGAEITERFKVANPFKVPCTVNLCCSARGGVVKGGGAAAPLAYDVEPKKCVIPPHEHRYVTTFFTPKAMEVYHAVFEAEVEQGTDANTKLLSFELLGEGTLPNLSVQQPVARTDDGKPLLQFPRLLVNHTATLPLQLFNSGILPATFALSMPTDGPFSCLAAGQQLSLEAKASLTLQVQYKPTDPGDASAAMELSVMHNSFEDASIVLDGKSFIQDVAFDDMPDEAENEALKFGDVEVGSSKSLSFTMRNHSEVAHRFEWPTHPGLSFSPTTGHLHAHATKSVVVTFSSDSPLLHEQLELTLQTQKIQYLPGGQADWDDTLKVVKWLSDDELREHRLRETKRLEAEAAAAEAERVEAEETAESARLAAAAGGKAKTGGKGKEDKQRNTKEDKKLDVKEDRTVDPIAEKSGGSKEDAALEEAGDAEPSAAAAEDPIFEGQASAPALADGLGPSSASAASPSRRHKVIEVEPEPPHQLIFEEADTSGSATPRLLVSVNCQYAQVECETTALHFRPTMMFQTRSHTFQLRNTGEVALRFDWRTRASHSGTDKATDNPFAVEPTAGTIAPGSSQDIKLSFSPHEVDQFHQQLVCECDNLPPGKQPPTITVSGKSTRPYCHFELADSDYLRAVRRPPEMPGPDGSLGPLDPETRVIEFESLGTKVRNTKRFYVVNPTSVPYEFVWENEQELKGGRNVLGDRSFRCQSRRGMVLPGRKFEMVFDFTPDSVHVQESFWRFRIPSLQIGVPFLLVGATIEPKVSLDRTRHNFGPLLIGQRARDTLQIINQEHIPFAFAFERNTFATGGLGAESVVEMNPISGVVGPGASLPIELSFAPTLEKQFNFNIELVVKNKSRPLVLNVKGEGFAIHDVLQLEDSRGKKLELSAHAPTRVDFGQVHVNDRVVKQLSVLNAGPFSFDVSLELKLPPGSRTPPVSITPDVATVKRNERFVFQLAYQPTSDQSLPAGLSVQCCITNGRTYVLQLLGRGKRPKLAFSSLEHNFGPCFISTPQNKVPAQVSTLRLTNEDDGEVYFDMPFEATPFLTASSSRTVLAPKEHADITLTFAPPAVESYVAEVPFLINGLSPVRVKVLGEGCEMRLELLDSAADQQVNFGAVHPRQQATRSVVLINRSRREVDLSVADASDALRHKSVQLSLGSGALHCSLRPREKATLTMNFTPSARIPPFTEQVALHVCSIARPMLIVSGACVAMELKLEMDQLTFGQVVLNSRITRRLMLQNMGDMPSAFHLDNHAFAPDFSISPLEGYLQPHEDINLEVTFHPVAVNRDIRYERMPLYVEGQSALALTLTGMCIDASPESQTLVFKTRVREPTKQAVQVKNPSPTLWRIQPIVQDDSWSGPEVLEVPAGQTVTYEVTYCPMVMTGEGELHQGSLFFPLADGSAIYYKLEGESSAPQAADNIRTSIPCKQATVLPLTVTNWMKQPQRFKVDIRAPDADLSTQLSGHQYMDVPANVSRSYALNFYAYKEGVTAGEVHFVNEKTGEYIYFQLKLNSSPAAVLKVIDMQSPLRQLSTHDLYLANPLETVANFSATVDNAEVAVPSTLQVEPHGQGCMRLEWRPLLPRELTSRLTVASPELGTYLYDLRVKALPVGEQKALNFKVALGGSQMLRFRFFNYLRRQETYTVSLASGTDFSADTSVVAPAATDSSGVEVSINVTYEPSKVGDVTDVLTVSSAEGGEYVCNLHGQSLPPKPQGPIVIKAGGSTQVLFKNVFANVMEFSMTCEPAVFSVVKSRESVPAKQPIQVAVAYKPTTQAATAMGKLTIASVGTEPGNRWVYYLSGQ